MDGILTAVRGRIVGLADASAQPQYFIELGLVLKEPLDALEASLRCRGVVERWSRMIDDRLFDPVSEASTVVAMTSLLLRFCPKRKRQQVGKRRRRTPRCETRSARELILFLPEANGGAKSTQRPAANVG